MEENKDKTRFTAILRPVDGKYEIVKVELGAPHEIDFDYDSLPSASLFGFELGADYASGTMANIGGHAAAACWSVYTEARIEGPHYVMNMVNALMEAINTDMNLIANRYKRMYRKWYGEAGRLHAKIKHMENSNKEQGRIRAELESHKRWSEKVIGNMNGRIAEDRKDLIEKDKEIARLTARNEYLEKRLAEQEEPTQQHKFKVGDVIRRGGDLRRKVTRLTDSGDYLLCRLGERSLSAPWRAGFVDEQFRLVEQARSTQEEVEEAARAAGNATAERIERDLRELFTGVAIKADEVNTNGDVFTRDAFRGWDLGGPDRSKSHLRGFDGVIHLYGTAYPLSDFCMTELPLHDQPVVNHQVDHDEIVPNYYEFEMYGEEFDVTDVIQATGLSFCLGNVLKYIVRAGRKPGEGALKDLKKAKEYLLREMIEVENSEEG